MAHVPGLKLSVSATTRSKRKNERDEHEYFFLTKEDFVRWVEEGRFLEWAEYTGNLYGTPARPVETELQAGYDVILEIELKGAEMVLAQCPDALMIYIMPPSLEELERRLRGRATDAEAAILKRMARAEEEMAEVDKKMKLNVGRLHYAIVNDTVKRASQELAGIIERIRDEDEQAHS